MAVGHPIRPNRVLTPYRTGAARYADRRTRDVRVVLMSAVGEERAEGAGADAFVGKPFDVDELESGSRIGCWRRADAGRLHGRGG